MFLNSKGKPLKRPQTRVKHNLDQCISEVVALKDEQGFIVRPYKDFSRDRILTLSKMLRLPLNFCKGSMISEVQEFRDEIGEVSETAVLKARKKVLPCAFEYLFYRQNELDAPVLEHPDDLHFYAADGSDFRSNENEEEPDTQVNAGNGHRNGRFHLNALMDVDNHIIVDAQICEGSKNSEEDSFVKFVEDGHFDKNACLLGDRLYGDTFKCMAACQENHVHFLLRTQDITSRTSFMRNVKGIPSIKGECDVDITMHLTPKTSKKARWDPYYKHLQNPEIIKYYDENKGYFVLKFRLIRYKLKDSRRGEEYACLVTDLDREHYSAQRLIREYTKRWGLETAFEELKVYCGTIFFHSAQKQLVEQEIWAHLVMFNYTQFLILLAGPIETRGAPYKANFAAAAKRARDYFRTNKHVNAILSYIRKHASPVKEKDRSYERASPQNIGPTSFYKR